jgi:protein-L-isoaspartate(D-aspartate) O-methyltransferase
MIGNWPTKSLFVIAVGLAMTNACGQVNYDAEREALVADLREYSKLSESYGAPPISESILVVIGRVPRHEFVPDLQKPNSYANKPLPIGADQTISQPYIVALMTDLAGVDKDQAVLEIGTGSGYQAAVLSELAGDVYTIEIIDMLGRRAARDLKRLGYDNVTVRVGDGYAGWPEHAPFDAIIVTAAPDKVPQPLIDQLAVGGRMVIPVGPQHDLQVLQRLTKEASGDVTVENITVVRFVPFTRNPEKE